MDPAFSYSAQFHIPPILDLIAIILFAITGALSAAKRGYDWIGAMSIALVTGCGGGLIRDILLNVRPVFLEHEAYIWAVFAAVLLSIYVFPLVSRMRWIFLVADALGLAMYAVIGTQKSLNTRAGDLRRHPHRHAQRNRRRANPGYSHPGGSEPAEAGAMVRGDCVRRQYALLSPEPSLARAPRRRRDPRRSRCLHREDSRAPLRSSDPSGKARGVRYPSFVSNRGRTGSGPAQHTPIGRRRSSRSMSTPSSGRSPHQALNHVVVRSVFLYLFLPTLVFPTAVQSRSAAAQTESVSPGALGVPGGDRVDGHRGQHRGCATGAMPSSSPTASSVRPRSHRTRRRRRPPPRVSGRPCGPPLGRTRARPGAPGGGRPP